MLDMKKARPWQRIGRRKEVFPVDTLPYFQHEVIPKNIPKADVRRFIKLLRSGVPQDEAEEIVMQDWRERWARGCGACVAGQLLSRRVSARLTLALVTDWAQSEYGMSADAVQETVEWVAARELERRGGVRRGDQRIVAVG